MNKWLATLFGIFICLFLVIAYGIYQNGKNGEVQSNLKLASASSLRSTNISGFKRASQLTPIVFPDDFGPHTDYQTEWWYYTGNLKTAEGRHFGYQLTFFRRALLPTDQSPVRSSHLATNQVYMAHFALTDVVDKRHYAFEKLGRGAGEIAGAQAVPYRVWLEDWFVEEIHPGVYRLYAEQDGIELDIYLTSLKEPILHGLQGYSQKGIDPGNASHYYSQTRLASQGSISIQNRQYQVNGLSWKDHEYSTSALSAGQIGWDWFSIQLDNQYELMVFQIRREDGTIDPFSSGTLVTPDTEPIHLSKEDFTIEVLDNWTSPRSQAIYPSMWKIQVPSHNLALEVNPYLKDQELNLTYIYWEGAVAVFGEQNGQSVSGSGYVEMTGYAGSMSGEF